jgi:hypothetical protein
VGALSLIGLFIYANVPTIASVAIAIIGCGYINAVNITNRLAPKIKDAGFPIVTQYPELQSAIIFQLYDPVSLKNIIFTSCR